MTGNASIATWIARFSRVSPVAGAYLSFRCLGFPRFRRVEASLPMCGRILDAGCGHGLLSILAADGAAGRTVVGIDRIDGRLRTGREVARRHGVGNVRFERGDIATPPEGPFDAIVVADVLFYFPLREQLALLGTLAGRLAEGGRLVVKEQVARPRWKAGLVHAQERIVVGLKVRLGRSREWASIAPAGVHLWDAGTLLSELGTLGLDATAERLDRRAYLSHHLFIAAARGRSPSLQDPARPA